MRYARVVFSNSVLKHGLPALAMANLFHGLPNDAKLIGFGTSQMHLLDYLFVSSDKFIDVPDGTLPPDIYAKFATDSSGNSVFRGFDYGKAFDPGAPVVITVPGAVNSIPLAYTVTGRSAHGLATPDPTAQCAHEWDTYMGLCDTFNYCKKCNVKQ